VYYGHRHRNTLRRKSIYCYYFKHLHQRSGQKAKRFIAICNSYQITSSLNISSEVEFQAILPTEPLKMDIFFLRSIISKLVSDYAAFSCSLISFPSMRYCTRCEVIATDVCSRKTKELFVVKMADRKENTG
jgi:hypothetical protein